MKTLKLFYPATKGRTRRAFGFRRLPLGPQRSSSAPASPRGSDAGGSLNATIAVQECGIGPLEARAQGRARRPSHGGELREARGVEGGRATFDAVHQATLGKQEFGKVGAILPGRARDQGDLAR